MNKDDAKKLLCDLLSIKSVNHSDDEGKVAEYLKAVQEEKETLEEYAFGLKDALDKAGVYVELKQPSCLSRKELMNFYSRG